MPGLCSAFVVNLPKLEQDQLLAAALVADEFPREAPHASDFLAEVQRLQLRNLPEYLPITAAAREELTDDLKMTVRNRVYIINAVALPHCKLPFVIHWPKKDRVPKRALVVTGKIDNLPEPQPDQHRISLQYYIHNAPGVTGLDICGALLLSIPSLKGDRNRVRIWNTFERIISGLAELVRNKATREEEGDTGPVPSVDWDVGSLHPVSPMDFVKYGGDGVCEHWPAPGVWLNIACNNCAGRAVVTPLSVMDFDTWAAYIAHNVKCNLLCSVWPAMACASQHMLRGWVNDVERSMFWLAVDAATLSIDASKQEASTTSDTEQSFGVDNQDRRLASTLCRWNLRESALAPWPAASADLCTSDHVGQVTHPI